MKQFIFIFIVIFSFTIQLSAIHTDTAANSHIFDSIDQEINTAFEKKDKVTVINLLNSKCKILFNQGLYVNELILLDSAIKLSAEGTDTIKYPEIKELYMESLYLKGAVYSYVSKYEEAVKSLIKMDKYNAMNNILYKTKFYNGMGVAFSMSGKFDQAAKYYTQTLYYVSIMKNSDEKYNCAFAPNANLAGVFLAQHKYDSAYMYIMEAQKLAILMKNKDKELNCLQLLGTLNSRLGKSKLAIGYYNEAYNLAMESGNYFTIPSIKLNISDIYAAEKNYDAALPAANEALEIAKKFDMKKIEMNALKAISHLYKQKGNIEKALHYLEKSDEIREVLFSQDNEERFLRQKTDFDIYKLSVEKDILDKNMEIKEGQRIIHNLIIFIIILLLTLTLVYLTQKLVKQERARKLLDEKYNLDIDTYIDKQKDFEDEIEQKNRDLFLNSLSIAKNSELTSLLMQKIKILKTNVSTKGQVIINEIVELIMELRKDSCIGELNECLKHIPDDFYDKLDLRYPDLTLGEKKICALMSFGLSSKNIANMTGKSNGAIGNIKFRIRQKINVDTKVDLEDFMFHIRES